MRILTVGNLYPPHAYGGYEVVWRSAVKHLRANGHEARVLTTDERVPDVGDVPGDPDVHRELRWYWHDHVFVEPGPRGTLQLERHNAEVLRRHLKELRPDLVMWWAMGAMSLALVEQVRRARVPALGVVHDAWMLYGPDRDCWLRRWSRAGVFRELAERITGIPTRFDPGRAGTWTFNSAFIRDVSSERWTLPRTEVINPGIDPSVFPAAEPRPWRWRLAYVGRIERTKGIATALEALAQLPREATLRVVGDGDRPHLADLRALAVTLGLKGRVSFEGAVGRAALGGVYADADAIVFPVTWQEPFGLVPIEAMAVGRPVVATGTGGSGEYLKDGENALLFEPGDGGALAAALRRVAGDEMLRERLRTGGFATAAAHTEQGFNEALERAAVRAADAATCTHAGPRAGR